MLTDETHMLSSEYRQARFWYLLDEALQLPKLLLPDTVRHGNAEGAPAPSPANTVQESRCLNRRSTNQRQNRL